MIPYFKIPSLEILDAGPIHLELQPFGVLVAIGILVGSWFAQRRARQEGVDLMDIRGAVAWAVVPGFIISHWVAILFYFPERITTEGWVVMLKIWSGISSFGGFLGAIIGLAYYFGRQRRPWLREAEIILQALVVGWVFGRLACTVAYDHPGAPTDFFLGQEYGESGGVVRHNLGFYEFLFTLFVLTPVMLWMYRLRPRQGAIMATVALLYAPVRFGLDFLRATDLAGSDSRYLGLTPAQYLSIGLFFLGLYLLRRSRNEAPIAVAAELPELAHPPAPAAPKANRAKGAGRKRSSTKGKKKRRR